MVAQRSLIERIKIMDTIAKGRLGYNLLEKELLKRD
jgi:hypothetical protein